MSVILINFLMTFIYLHLHFLILAGGVVLLNKKVELSSELYRKLFHIVAVFSIMPIVVPSNSWEASALVCAVFIAEAFIGGRYSGMLQTVGMQERKQGEQQKSMFLLYGVYIFLILNCWGALDQKWMVILSVVAWGVGDAAAALVGKRFGKHKLTGSMIEGTKSVEGTAAMFIMSFISVYLLYRRHSSLSNPLVEIWVCLCIAAMSASAELFSKNGMDTVICPLSAMTGFMILTFAAGGI